MKKPKRILFINYEYPPIGGGAGIAFSSLLSEFATYPIIIDAITAHPHNISSFDKYTSLITHYRIPAGKIKNYHYQTTKNLTFFSYSLYKTIKRLILTHHYDHNFTFFTFPCGLVSHHFRHIVPYSLFLRGSDVPGYNSRFALHERILFKKMAKRIWGRAQCVVANSPDLKELALATAPQQSILVIPNGIHSNLFTPNTLPHDTFNILTVSRLIPRKNIFMLIKAFHDFYQRHHDSRLTIIGDGPEKNRLQHHVRKLCLDNVVNFIGYQDRLTMPDHYHNHDVYVSTSIHEGMSNALLEAMASGLSIITTNTGGARDIIRDNGYIISNNAHALVTALETMYKNPILRISMGAASRQCAQTYSWKYIAQHYMNLIHI